MLTTVVVLMLYPPLASLYGRIYETPFQDPEHYATSIGKGESNIFRNAPPYTGGAISAPEPIYSPDPEYTKPAQKVNLEGTVVLLITVSSQGTVRDIKIVRALGMGLEDNAVKAVKLWKFKPALKDGIAAAVEVSVDIDFKMH